MEVIEEYTYQHNINLLILSMVLKIQFHFVGSTLTSVHVIYNCNFHLLTSTLYSLLPLLQQLKSQCWLSLLISRIYHVLLANQCTARTVLIFLIFFTIQWPFNAYKNCITNIHS